MTFCDGLRQVVIFDTWDFVTDSDWIRRKISYITFWDGLGLDLSQNFMHDILWRIETGSVANFDAWDFVTDSDWIRRKISYLTFCEGLRLDQDFLWKGSSGWKGCCSAPPAHAPKRCPKWRARRAAGILSSWGPFQRNWSWSVTKNRDTNS
jgi:hypothetical protein